MSDLVKRYRDLQISIGGCHDGYCVIKKPQGMHTNGGCNCLEDMKLHERSRVGGLLKYGQEMADRIEELEKALTEKMLSELSALGQAQEAYERQLELEAVLSDVDAWVDDLGMYAQEGHEPATVFKRVKEVLNK